MFSMIRGGRILISLWLFFLASRLCVVAGGENDPEGEIISEKQTSAASVVPGGHWAVPACLLKKSCARFTFNHNTIRQSRWSRLELMGGGVLRFDSPNITLLWNQGGLTSSLTFSSPCGIRLSANGRYEPACAGQVIKDGKAPGSSIASGARAAVARDTKYRAVFTPGGALCLQLEEGAMDVIALDGSAQSKRIHPGQGVFFSEPTSTADADPAVPSYEILSGKMLADQCSSLRTANHATLTRSQTRSGTTAREVLEDLLLELPNLSSKKAFEKARALVQRYPNSPEAPRALYLVWLQADDALDPGIRARSLELLRARYPESFWTRSVLALGRTSVGPGPGSSP